MKEESKLIYISPSTQEIIERRIQAWIENRSYLDHNCSIDKLSREVGYNRKFTSYVVNRTRGCSFPIFLNSLRLSFLENFLLEYTEEEPIKLTYLAYISGFSTYGKFASAIRDRLGVPPNTFVKMVRNRSLGI